MLNNDGQISREELRESLKKTFAFLDKNQDGHISPAELQTALTERTGRTQKGLVKMMFETLDADGNGMVSMDELASLAI